MSDQVQHLIDRIPKEAVAAAERQANELVAEARARAERIVAEAEAKAAAAEREAGIQAKELLERGQRALQQASRDILISVGQRLEQVLRGLMVERAGEALRPDVVEQMLLRLADGFSRNGIAEGQIDVMIGPADRERLVHFAMAELRRRLEQGLDIRVDPRLDRGFRIAYARGSIHHDFTPQAVADVLVRFVGPQLAEIVMKAALAQPTPQRPAPAAGGSS